jgi:hypothetical protein
MRLLGDFEWTKWSDREVAGRCGVSNTFVGGLRSSLSTVDSEAMPRTFTNKHGTISEMAVASINKNRPVSPSSPRVISDPQEPEGDAWLAIAMDDLSRLRVVSPVVV